MPTDQDQGQTDQVVTGLAGMQAPGPKSTTDTEPKAEPSAPTDVPTDTPTEPAPLIQANFGPDVTAKVAEVNQPLVIAEAQKAQEELKTFTKEDMLHAESEDLKRDFLARVAASRAAAEPKPYTPPAVPERIAEQTRLEMEAGKQRVKEFTELEASRPRRPPPDTGMVAVFRPDEFVPNQKKGEGLIASNSARTL